MLFLVIETFRRGDAAPAFARLEREGRRLPQGVAYVASWVTRDLTRCYQVVECQTRAELEAWMAAWEDLVLFEVVPVLTSDAARQVIAGRDPPMPEAPRDSG